MGRKSSLDSVAKNLYISILEIMRFGVCQRFWVFYLKCLKYKLKLIILKLGCAKYETYKAV